MTRGFGYYFSLTNLIFVGILIAGFAIMYVCAIALKALRAVIAEKKKYLLLLFDGLFGPFMMFVVITAYSCAYTFLRLPFVSADMLGRTPGILLLINAGWLLMSGGEKAFITILKVINQKILTIYSIICIVATAMIIVILYYEVYPALILSLILAAIFIMLVNEITRIAPELHTGSEQLSSRRLIITHIYIATSETDEAVKRAIQAIKQAIEATEGTEKQPYASLTGFTHGAFDILVRYFITTPEELDQIKQQVNLAIIRKLGDINVKLSAR